jgi:hypothetical protein
VVVHLLPLAWQIVQLYSGKSCKYLVHPFIIAGQIATAYYFAHYLLIIPLFGIIDNVLSIIGRIIIEVKQPKE